MFCGFALSRTKIVSCHSQKQICQSMLPSQVCSHCTRNSPHKLGFAFFTFNMLGTPFQYCWCYFGKIKCGRAIADSQTAKLFSYTVINKLTIWITSLDLRPFPPPPPNPNEKIQIKGRAWYRCTHDIMAQHLCTN